MPAFCSARLESLARPRLNLASVRSEQRAWVAPDVPVHAASRMDTASQRGTLEPPLWYWQASAARKKRRVLDGACHEIKQWINFSERNWIQFDLQIMHLESSHIEPVEKRSDSRRVFIAATPAKVYAAMSDPARAARWWGPDGFKNTIHRFAFRPDGTWLLTMHGPDGIDYPNESRFTRLAPGEIFEIEHLSGHHFLLSIELEPSSQGTQVHWRQTFDTVKHYERIAEFVAGANEQNLQRLAAAVLRSFDAG